MTLSKWSWIKAIHWCKCVYVCVCVFRICALTESVLKIQFSKALDWRRYVLTISYLRYNEVDRCLGISNSSSWCRRHRLGRPVCVSNSRKTKFEVDTVGFIGIDVIVWLIMLFKWKSARCVSLCRFVDCRLAWCAPVPNIRRFYPLRLGGVWGSSILLLWRTWWRAHSVLIVKWRRSLSSNNKDRA